MHLSLIVDKINSVISCSATCVFSQLPTFSCGKRATQLVKICSEQAPFSKVLVLYSQNDFSIFGKNLTQEFLSAGLKPLSVIVKDSNISLYNLKSSIPEDVRIIASISTELNEMLFNIASELKVKGVIVVKKIPIRLITQNALSCNGAFFVIDEGLKVDLAKEYSLCIGKIISLLDIRLNAYLKIKEIKRETEQNFSQLIDKLIHLNAGEKEFTGELLSIKFALEVLESESGVVPLLLTHSQAVYLLQRLTKTSTKIPPTNFIALAKEREKRFGDNYLSLLKSYKRLSNTINDYDNIQNLLQGLSAQAQRFLKEQAVFNENLKKLGGKEKPLSKESVKDLRLKGAFGGLNLIYLIMQLSII